MELNQTTISLLVLIIGQIVGLVVAIRKPTEDLAKKQLSDSKDQAIIDKEADKKAEVLAKEVQWAKESTEKKFTEFGIRLDKAFELAANHTHTVDVKVEALTKLVNEMNLNINRLHTIIEERIPKKNI